MNNNNNTVKARFENLAEDREKWQKKNSYYYDAHKNYFRFLVQPGLRVLEIGCGLGDLLSAVKPSYGVGIDISQQMVDAAQQRHPQLHFQCGDAQSLEMNEFFDVIILSDVIGHFQDIQQVFSRLKKYCHADTRLCVGYYNSLWEPILKLAEMLGLKMPQKAQNWLTSGDIDNLLFLAGFDLVKQERKLLLPKNVPLLATLCNRFLATLPGLNRLCLSMFMVARLSPVEIEKRDYSVTIVIPCRNEKGNIRNAITRLPMFGSQQEIIFIDGHSTDGTPEEIKTVMAENPDKNIRFMVQEGKGKGDAVRKAFAAAQHEILMILDADLTMPPEDLPKFYHAIAQHQGEFINGCRLIYPMEDEAMRFLNMLGNKFFAMAFSWLLNQRIRDTLCGTKVLSKKDYDKIAANRHYFGDFDPFGDFDLLFGASKANLKIIEMPIRYRDRVYGETNISRFSHGWLLLKMTVFAFFKLKAI
jgi:SAM-dependent methyltransferase